MSQDPLDGFRSKSPAEIEAELRQRLGPDDFLVDLFQMGQVMQEWVETPAGAYLHRTLRDRVNENLAALLREPTADTDAARRAHAEARAAHAALELIQSAIGTGRMAEQIITSQESTPE